MAAINLSKTHLFLILLIGLVASLFFIGNSTFFQANPGRFSTAILLDFLITVPILYYLIIRKTEIPKFTVISVFVLCLILCGFALPTDHQANYQTIRELLIPIIEVGVVGFLIFKARAIAKSMKKQPRVQGDFFDHVSQACAQVFPGRVGALLATEIGVIYYAFFANKKPATIPHEYSYYKKSGIQSTIGVLIFLIIIETFVAHLLLERWNVTVAWVLTGLGGYTILQMVAFLRSMNKRKTYIDTERELLVLNYGCFAKAEIPLADIQEIELTRKSLPEDGGIIPLSPLDMLDSHNLILHLNQIHTVHRLYGIKKEGNGIAIYIDERDIFRKEIEEWKNGEGEL